MACEFGEYWPSGIRIVAVSVKVHFILSNIQTESHGLRYYGYKKIDKITCNYSQFLHAIIIWRPYEINQLNRGAYMQHGYFFTEFSVSMISFNDQFQ